jgi:hypothetical protein
LAGLKQHFLPQFLMKGFQSRFSDGDPNIWICRKEGKVFEPKINKIGMEIGFYGADEPNSLDESITNYEGDIAPKIDQLRQSNVSCEINDPSIADFVAHISMRTQHLRETMADSLEDFCLGLMKHIENPANLIPMLKKKIVTDPSPWMKAIEKNLIQRGLSQKQRRKFLFEYVENNIVQVEPHLQELRKQVEEKIRSVASIGQLQALARGVIPNGIAVSFHELHWHLFYSDKTQFILGDLGVLMRFQPGGIYRLFPEEGRLLDAVFLPISSNHMIVGTVAMKAPNLTPEEINVASAKNSREFFIGSKQSLVESYRPEIGTLNPLITDEE